MFNSLKDSLIKAYCEQPSTVASKLNLDGENWGIIIRYKEPFWGDFTELFKLGVEKYKLNSNSLNPENVFIMDVHSWDKMVHIVKTKKLHSWIFKKRQNKIIQV